MALARDGLKLCVRLTGRAHTARWFSANTSSAPKVPWSKRRCTCSEWRACSLCVSSSLCVMSVACSWVEYGGAKCDHSCWRTPASDRVGD